VYNRGSSCGLGITGTGNTVNTTDSCEVCLPVNRYKTKIVNWGPEKGRFMIKPQALMA